MSDEKNPNLQPVEPTSTVSNVVSLADFRGHDTVDQKEGVSAPRKKFEDLAPAAQRALQEAEQRRNEEQLTEHAKEIGGRGGKDPARYGDWEIKGRTIDF